MKSVEMNEDSPYGTHGVLNISRLQQWNRKRPFQADSDSNFSQCLSKCQISARSMQ